MESWRIPARRLRRASRLCRDLCAGRGFAMTGKAPLTWPSVPGTPSCDNPACGVVTSSERTRTMDQNIDTPHLYPATLFPEPEGGFTVTFRDLPEAVTYGVDEGEARTMAVDVLELAIAELMARGEDIPTASAKSAVMSWCPSVLSWLRRRLCTPSWLATASANPTSRAASGRRSRGASHAAPSAHHADRQRRAGTQCVGRDLAGHRR